MFRRHGLRMLANMTDTDPCVAFAEGDAEAAERDAHQALACAADIEPQLGVPDVFDFLAHLAAQAESYPEAPRLFGAAEAIRHRTGEVRYQIYQADYEASVTALRDAMGDKEFDAAGPRAPRCPPRRRSLTRSVAAANANAPPGAGPRSPNRARRRPADR
jgi:hypothetical protein